eukprot:CAMPEP_0172582114 /NCGR_PEP_ID=MMETSP1068-20121228/1557_1 /TAXON_ID=35684 /ORGANISM="Pseudopedinella elastica, Strain CCMP716" /LENGTH=115 /DNA_ID=CAMNT_0013375355 /DNA_START=44 /DNA_END=391 /DNA_ORIENTATION=-
MFPAVLLGLVESVLLLYAGVQSFRAIQSTSQNDDKQWLTFWLLYTVSRFIFAVADYILFVIPFYGEIKIGFIVFIGVFNGASMIYPILEPFLLQADEVAKKYEAQARAEASKYTK